MKRFMIAVLAVAVLFGFAACDNQSAPAESTDDKVIVSLSVTPKDGYDVYFAGEEVDLDNYVVTGKQNNGKVVEIASEDLMFVYPGSPAGTALVATGADNDSATEKNVGTIYYNGPYKADGTVKADVKATVYYLTNFEVTGDVKQYYVGQNPLALNRGDYVVTGYALDSEDNILHQRALAADEYTINTIAVDSDTTTAEAKAFVSGLQKLPVAPVYYADDSNTAAVVMVGDNKTTDITISVIADSVASIEISLKKGAEAIIGKAAGKAANYVDVKYIMTSKLEYKNDEFKGTVKASIDWKDSASFGDTTPFASAQVIKAEYKVGETTLSDEVTVTPVKNYIKSFDVTIGETTSTGTAPNKTITLPATVTTIKLADLKVTATWADTTATNIPTTPDAATINAAIRMSDGVKDVQEIDLSLYEAGKNIPVKFYLDANAAGMSGIVTDKTSCDVASVVKATV